MQELVKIEVTPPLVEINYQEAKTQLQEYLKQYDVVVTPETLANSKKLAADINKQRKAMNDLLKKKIDEVGAPIKDLQAKVKELDGMWEQSRQALRKQIAAYEDKTRARAKELLVELRAFHWQDQEVNAEFHRAEIDDLVMISNITEQGNLTKKAKETVIERVRADRALQDKTRMRLMELENRCLKAGLRAPLGREHVASFLWAPDDQYNAHLEKIIAIEVKRQESADLVLRERQAQEQVQEARVTRDEPAPEPATEEPYTTPEPEPVQAETKPDAKPAPSGKQAITVTAIFKTEVDHRVTNEQVETELRRRLADAGLKSLSEIRIDRVDP